MADKHDVLFDNYLSKLLQHSFFRRITADNRYRRLKAEFNHLFRKDRARKFARSRRLGPLMLFFDVCNSCNARCVFCAHRNMRRPRGVMPFADFGRYVKSFVAAGGDTVNLTPIVGDFFLDPHFMERLDFLVQEPGVQRIFVTTNGILMDAERIDRLLLFGKRLSLYISLGGFDRETYCSIMGIDRFEQVKQQVEYLIRQKETTKSRASLTIDLRCPIQSCRGEFWDRLTHAQDDGLVRLRPTECFDTWGDKVSRSALVQAGLEPCPTPYKRGACTLIFNWPTVMMNGKICACTCRDLEGELIIGDLNQSTFRQIWNGNDRKQLIARQEQGDFPMVCKQCTFYRSIYSDWAVQ